MASKWTEEKQIHVIYTLTLSLFTWRQIQEHELTGQACMQKRNSGTYQWKWQPQHKRRSSGAVAACPTEEEVASSKDSGSSSIIKSCSQILHFAMVLSGKETTPYWGPTCTCLGGNEGRKIDTTKSFGKIIFLIAFTANRHQPCDRKWIKTKTSTNNIEYWAI